MFKSIYTRDIYTRLVEYSGKCCFFVFFVINADPIKNPHIPVNIGDATKFLWNLETQKTAF
jgi:hypothetical protein